MKRMRLVSLIGRGFTLLALPVLLCSCASVGKNFAYQSVSQVELGQMRSSDYATMFGKPSSVTTKTTGDGKFELVRYLYSQANMSTAKVRLLDLEFRNGTLSGYQYLSSFDDDKTTFSAAAVDQIKQGATTKQEVISLLGKPHGKALCPSVADDFKDRCGKGTEVWVWSSFEKLSTFGAAYGGDKMANMQIYVVFDQNGVVTAVDTNKTNKE